MPLTEQLKGTLVSLILEKEDVVEPEIESMYQRGDPENSASCGLRETLSGRQPQQFKADKNGPSKASQGQ